ncbi:MAG: sulfotransferase domain-containing protein [Deltaproteobacteria bacterium]|nr:sulfotransferase domain-containing protein [Deltaproteobacteria bacterium]
MLDRSMKKSKSINEEKEERLRPVFLISGAQKSGTTAMFEYLAKHHLIVTSSIKEIDFFGCIARYNKGIGFYHSHFPLAENNPGKITFDASPNYLFASQAPKRIYDYNPNIKQIVLLREPVERAFSAWNMYRKLYKVDKGWFHNWMRRCDESYDKGQLVRRNIEKFDSFDYVIAEELSAQEKGKDIEASLLAHGLYSKQLERYFCIFKKEQILILEKDTFKVDTIRTLKQVEKFLGLSEHNWSNEDLASVFKGEYENDVPAKTKELLKAYYRPHNERLYKLINVFYNW